MSNRSRLEFEGIDPEDKSGVQTALYHIERSKVDELIKNEMESKLQRIRCIPSVISNPLVVYKGWNREGFEQCLAFVGIPDHDYSPKGVELPPQKNRHFLIYTTPNRRIKEWGWDVFDPNDESMRENQFGKEWVQLWP
ncbi:MAG: hypothetical protein KDA68_10320 [Planctomycetaceae bacterium]|nr:hypothetical protein [Planctomycetaceae bacterium]